MSSTATTIVSVFPLCERVTRTLFFLAIAVNPPARVMASTIDMLSAYGNVPGVLT
jgi:hypothetical protein